jgi:SAM-dependent methyltransferase
MSATYTSAYFEEFKDVSRESAAVIAPLVTDLIPVKSVIDFGCGLGQWLAAFERSGVSEIRGLDGSYIDLDQLEIPRDAFRVQDLTAPYVAEKQFDLATCVEVAEHLAEVNGSGLIRSLTDAAPVVLFSAAIPHQPGKDHVNPQWPDYWARLFRQYGFVPVDALRHVIWDDARVAWWYQQNILLYVREEMLAQYPKLKSLRDAGFDRPRRLVHPAMIDILVEWGTEESNRYWELYAAQRS